MLSSATLEMSLHSYNFSSLRLYVTYCLSLLEYKYNEHIFVYITNWVAFFSPVSKALNSLIAFLAKDIVFCCVFAFCSAKRNSAII